MELPRYKAKTRQKCLSDNVSDFTKLEIRKYGLL